jgi:hypothetical protein
LTFLSRSERLPSTSESSVVARARILFVVLVASAALASGAPASASTEPVKLDATLVGTITWGTVWCCGSYYEFQGRAVLPAIGAVTFTGTWTRGCQGPADPTTVCFRSLGLALVARDGATLSLSGYNEWVFPLEPPPAQLTWSITGGTGRLADFSGSGTYTVEQTGLPLIISLSGTLQP